MAWNEALLRATRDGAILQEGTREGRIYNASRRTVGVAASSSIDTIFITSSLPVYLFQRDIGRSGLGVMANIYRGPTYTGGVLSTGIYSVNDLIGDGTLSSVDILTGATVTATGEQSIATSYAIGNTSNQGQGGLAQIKQPLYMLPNTSYLLRITSLDTQAQDITSELAWYEGYL
ncbi:hypothetical protein [Citrobacter phage CVT22]|uniref:Uncharacterized protein n=1 Tax=Citrobacter phage CVT22 TaxID=1622234 RepID=A0A0R6C6R9_9CAUD|nr:hypothetical protein APL39_gp25 [Citrobacter phage CVT22]AJT60729.1 hypothetical protein [Citrobacter phage CVT22]